MLLSNLYRHIAFPGWNSTLLFLKTNMGTDPTRAKHQIMKMYIKALCFLNSEGYFSRLTKQKYRLTAIAAIVPTLLVPNVNICLPATDCVTKDPPTVEKTCNCKRYTDSRHQNITYSQSYQEHVGNRAQPVVSVHSIKSEKISEDGHNIGNSKQNCFSTN